MSEQKPYAREASEVVDLWRGMTAPGADPTLALEAGGKIAAILRTDPGGGNLSAHIAALYSKGALKREAHDQIQHAAKAQVAVFRSGCL